MALICDDIGNMSANLTEISCDMMGIFNSTTEVTGDMSQNKSLTPIVVNNNFEDFFSGRNATNFEENVTELRNLVENGSLSDSSNKLVPIVIVSIVSTISLAAVLGNLAIVLCIVKNRSMLTVYNIYTASLALADLLVGVVVMTNMSVYTYHGYWPLGHEMCTIWIVFDFTCCTVSMLHLDAIAFDRYKSVTSPLVYRATVTKARAVKISMGMWFLGVVLWLPSILWFRITDDINGKILENDCYFLPDKYYIVGQASVAYYCPVCFMVILYLVLFCALNKRLIKSDSSNVGKQSIYTVPDSSGKKNTLSIELEKRDKLSENEAAQMSSKGKLPHKKQTHSNNSMVASKSRRIRDKTSREIENGKISQQNGRCIRTLGAIILVFLICWLPFIIFWPLVAFCESCVPANLYETSYWLAYGNSFLNPYIYFVLNSDFRRAFGKVFRRRSANNLSRSVVSNNSYS